MIPPFNNNGSLPNGIHAAEWKEIVSRFGTNPKRRMLLAGLHDAVRALRTAGCSTLYIDGSFVTAKPDPGDFDACWDVKGVDPARLNPTLLDFSNDRTSQKSRYLGELFPAQVPEGTSGKTYLEFFQTVKGTGEAKGIVVLDLTKSQ
jgi:hypothetical protein